MEDVPISDMTKFFMDTAQRAFREARTGSILSKVDPQHVASKTFMLLRIFDSVFKTSPLKETLINFFGSDTGLFSSTRTKYHECTTRVAVTSAKDSAATRCLITSYNRPNLQNCSDFEREDNEDMDMKIWEAALATSAAPFYFRPFSKEETKKKYSDGALYANCPAEVALEEMSKLWPNNSVSLDVLLSLGTGAQNREVNIPTAVKIGGFDALCAMFHSNLDTQKLWDKFESGFAVSGFKGRLRRLNPPIEGNYVALYHYRKMADLKKMVDDWTRTSDGAALVRDIADVLIASLFFFEPDENAIASSPRHLLDSSYDELQGTIRCRLSHESIGLKKLLEDRVDSFWYAKVSKDDSQDLAKLPDNCWTRIRPMSGSLHSELVIDNHKQKFRLQHTFRARRSSNHFQVIAVKLNDRATKIAVSGFPARLSDLQKRATLKWLQ
jgi:predicted acylesterase/phospholipase RssA